MALAGLLALASLGLFAAYWGWSYVHRSRTKAVPPSSTPDVEALGLSTAALIHDLSSPLTTLTVSLEALRKTPFGEPTHPSLSQAHHAASTLNEYVSSIRTHLHREQSSQIFSLSHVIYQVVELHRWRARKLEVELLVSLPESYYLVGHPMKLHQVFDNLVKNSLEAYSELRNSETRVSAILRPLVIEFLVSTPNEDQLEIRLSDQAGGIKPQILSQLFTPFSSTKKAPGNNGLGLALVKKTLELEFLGMIRCESELGRGTTFIITLPRYHIRKGV